MLLYSEWLDNLKKLTDFPREFQLLHSSETHTDKVFFISENTFIFKSLNHSRPNLEQREKINLNVYFHTTLWCLKFYEKTFWDITKKWENENLSQFFFILIQPSEMHGKSRQGLIILLAFYKRWFKVQFHWLLHFKIYLLCAEEPPEMFCKKVFLKMSPTGMQHRLQKRIQKRL